MIWIAVLAGIVFFFVGFLLASLRVKEANHLIKLEQTLWLEKEKDLIETKKQLLQEKECIQNEKNNLAGNLLFYKNKVEELEKQQRTKDSAMLSEFENLSNKIFKEKSNEFSTVNQKGLNQLLEPLNQSLINFSNKLEDNNIRTSSIYKALDVQIKNLSNSNAELSQEAKNLVNAFKNNHKIQGNWGEMILTSLLDNAGLIKGIHYKPQAFLKKNDGSYFRDENGRALQPDVTLTLPNQKQIIIDSKVSLNDFETYVNSEDAQEIAAALQRHIHAIKNHVDELSAKHYHRFGDSVPYSLMFIPVESAFLEALRTDPTLWEFAYKKEIILISPTNLLPVLKIIQQMWQMDAQNKNAAIIAKQANSIYEKFVGFAHTFEEIGTNITKSQDAYDKALGQLSNGKNSFSKQVEKLKALGISSTKEIPNALTNNDSDVN